MTDFVKRLADFEKDFPLREVSEGPLPFRRGGNGPKVVMLPPFDGVTEFYVNNMPTLAQHFDVICLEYPSEPVTPHRKISDYVNAFDKQLEALGIDEFSIVGASMGGMLAQELALLNPGRIRSMALVVTCDHYPFGKSLTFAEFMGNISPFFLRKPFPGWGVRLRTRHEFRKNPEQLKFCINTANKRHPEQILERGYIIKSFDTRDHLNKLTMPILVVTGPQDKVMPNKLSFGLLKNLPNGTHFELGNSGHFGFLTDAEIFNSHLIDFLKT